MAVDIYVMPLWRFKAGNFISPVEKVIGIRPKVVTAEGILTFSPATGWFDRWRARRQVAAIRKAVQAVNRVPVQWTDEGPVVYSQRVGWNLGSLRAFAAWLDHRLQLPTFEPAADGNDYAHPVMGLGIESPSCPHLVEHDCYSGYYLPCDFERVVQVEPYEMHTWSFTRSVGSSLRLRRELGYIGEHLQVTDDYEYRSDDLLGRVKLGFLQMREAAELSCRHQLPIIVWG
jgi:hypothetical protein